MPAKTFNIELKGDRDQARALAQVHGERLLLDFRRNNEFQNLQINSCQKHFFVNNQYIGTIQLQTVYGAETMVVSAPYGGRKKVEELWKPDPEQFDRIVPCIRSIDNHWWVACLSGTFDGPYYAFENRDDRITPEQMDDNAETELNLKLLSVGGAPINNCYNPLLYFVAQTGVRPEYLDIDWIEDMGSVPKIYTWERDPIINECFDIYGNSAWPQIAVGNISPRSSWDTAKLTVWGQEISIPRSGTEQATEYGEVQLINPYLVAIKSTFALSLASFYDAFDVLSSGGLLYRWDQEVWWQRYQYTDTSSWNWEELIGDEYSIRPERLAPSNFCAAYRAQRGEVVNTRTQGEIQCAVDSTSIGYLYPEPTVVTSSTEVYVDCFTVDGQEFIINGPNDNSYPVLLDSDNMMKYYHTNSPAAITGIMSAGLFTPDGYTQFGYFYVGPNNKNSLSSTHFPTNNSEFCHSIPNVIGLPEGVEFEGKIFLGMVRLNSERKVKVF